ncbi:MAG: T9SS type A sorting domain-containing protein [Bacteroidetes bacterium]|nr:T9SS type A sorting domain-containing protein [Bacteroidota bacterium]MBK9412282.1 T9SS type A sorting domain-containing protein [Bacteroidota bacterium]MBL0031809.1 T9SS type A sorting domain-containing protein [Bacteroidota bacterium]MBP6426807.1 T9SS type A sorting domain-containing protein [Bacteroidia bacterium]MBP6657098.1 T9SS type A sorting domain-containing protein [Bacteroidia bacterium]
MKKITILLLFVLMSMSKISQSAVIPVSVENIVFNPANIIVNVGDTIMWVWSAGFHTTTSTAIPVGATPWDAPIDASNPMFMYQVTVEGEYDFICSIHSSMGMVAHITVLGTSGLPSVSATQFSIVNNLVERDLAVKFHSGKNWQVELRSLTGAMVKEFSLVTETGRTEVFPVADLPNGIYIVRFYDGQSARSQRIIKQ